MAVVRGDRARTNVCAAGMGQRPSAYVGGAARCERPGLAPSMSAALSVPRPGEGTSLARGRTVAPTTSAVLSEPGTRVGLSVRGGCGEGSGRAGGGGAMRRGEQGREASGAS
jgi:hypothetical protein